MGFPCSKIAFTSRSFPAFPVTNTVQGVNFRLRARAGRISHLVSAFPRRGWERMGGRQLPEVGPLVTLRIPGGYSRTHLRSTPGQVTARTPPNSR